jgi:CRP-like cAMP-binding protein
MIEKLLMKLRRRDDIDAQEEKVLRDMVSEVRDFPGKTTIIREGEPLKHSTLLLDGLMGRYKDLRGAGRQITELHIPGDFADLHSFTLKHLDHDIMTYTPCRVAIVPHDRLKRITEEQPHLTRLLWFSTMMDAALHREWELTLGRRDGLARVAHIFCELDARLDIVGLMSGDSFALPLNQTELAECLGLTSVHVNRVLRELRARGLVEFRGKRVTMSDRAGLREVAEFDPAYLYMQNCPR